ncbi:hypothetical protein F8E02_10695 [Methanoculleus sp. Wushi-C6]|uniref:Uncharacterized protein n=1 Tax=Methanoculleus caldifontis TaxID=2651577 RepID=A0ABU3X317_9EURY|nr:hypothetical protein [Methanoculleus sp. Wushi-C6]
MPACNHGKHSPSATRSGWSEGFIREHSGKYKRRALWENLLKRMMCQTFKTIIKYLDESGQIASDSQGKICWIHNPDLVRRYAMREDLRI